MKIKESLEIPLNLEEELMVYFNKTKKDIKSRTITENGKVLITFKTECEIKEPKNE